MKVSNLYDVVWPSSKQKLTNTKLAKRLNTLEGKVVAEIWDWIFKGDIMFEALEKELTKRYPGIKFISWKEFGEIHGANEKANLDALPDRLKEFGVDCLICGVAC